MVTNGAEALLSSAPHFLGSPLISADCDSALATKAELIHNNLTAQAGLGYFPTPLPTMTALHTAIDGFHAAIGSENTQANIALRRGLREDLIDMLQKLAASLELTADGDMVKLGAAGFDLRKTPVRSEGPTPIPGNLRVRPTGTAGEAHCRCQAVPLADAYELEHTLDPNAGPWLDGISSTSSQNLVVTGLTRGKDYYSRARALGSSGPSGWSNVATRMVV